MTDLITDEMVEAAAKAGWNRDWPDKSWESIPDELADYYRSSTRATLEAAAPHIAAQALRDAAEMFGENQMIREGDAKEWLRLHAEALVHALLHLADVWAATHGARDVDLTPPPAREDHLR